jgi:hypothetical protein
MRDAIPQWEIDLIAQAIKAEDAEAFARLTSNVSAAWLERNMQSLLKMAGKERPADSDRPEHPEGSREEAQDRVTEPEAPAPIASELPSELPPAAHRKSKHR